MQFSAAGCIAAVILSGSPRAALPRGAMPLSPLWGLRLARLVCAASHVRQAGGGRLYVECASAACALPCRSEASAVHAEWRERKLRLPPRKSESFAFALQMEPRVYVIRRANARICSGLVPQQPPTMRSADPSRASLIASAHRSGPSPSTLSLPSSSSGDSADAFA